jgi:hypothetical protein
MVITDVPDLAPGDYEVRWTTLSAEDGELDRDTWSFTVVAAPTPSPTPEPSPTAVPSAAATVEAPTPAPSTAADGNAGGGSDAILPIIIVLIIGAAGAFYLVRRNRPA